MKPMPTVRQQVARATVQLQLKRRQIDIVVSSKPTSKRGRASTSAPRQQTYLDGAAIGVAAKLAKIAFCRYAVGCEAQADWAIPGQVLMSHIDNEQFANLVRLYMLLHVKPGNEFTVTHFDGRIYLYVLVQEAVATPEKGYFGIQLTVQG